MQNKYELIKNIVLKNVIDDGNYPTSINGVRFIRRNKPTEFSGCFYNSACIFVLQGQKQVIFASQKKIYKKGQYLLSCTDIPAVCRVEKATNEEPFVGILINFDSNILRQLIMEMNLQKTYNKHQEDNYLSVSNADSDLTDAFYRLAQLVDKPKDEILSLMVIKEIYYRLLTGPLGNQLLLINTKGTNSNQIAQAIGYLKNNYREKLNIENLATRVNMAPSSFYRNFRKITQISPLQYQKKIRLYEAQRLMLSGEYNAEMVSHIVGYESPTQFSREYKKLFGNPPITHVKKLVTI